MEYLHGKSISKAVIDHIVYSRSASAMCTPAMADGLSNNTSASWHCPQESTSTKKSRFDQMEERGEVVYVQSSSQERN